MSRPGPPKEREPDVARPLSPADALLSLQQAYGNRAIARTLSRRPQPAPPAPPQTAQTTTPPPLPPATHPSWADQTTAANRPLATEIDELEKFTDDELRKKRDEIAMKAAKWNDDKHADYERTLEALEFVATERGVAPMTWEKEYGYNDRHAIRRRNVRVVIEEGVRDTGSLKKSIATMNQTNDVKDDIEFFEKEADEWGREFTRQARDIGQRMLAQSITQILDVLKSYGLRSSTAVWGANEIIHGKDADKVVEDIVNAPEKSDVWEKDDDPEGKPGGARKRRVSLAAYVTHLKAQQEIVKKRQKEANAYVKHHPENTGLGDYVQDGDKPAWEAAMKRVREADAHLASMWATSERVHPVLAAFRGGKTSLRDVDLGDLDQTKGGSAPQMTEMLTNVLQKLADIGKVQSRLKDGSLNPLSLPPVVAMTKALMFVPEGSIRAGKVYDLVDDAQDKSVLKYIAEGLIALIVIAAILPSGGTSLGIGISIAGAALSAASAVEDWQTYQKQKTLVNTALDRAQALSTEEPSLVPFAIDLISLGLDGAPLVKAFGEGVALRNLIRAGEDVKNSAKVRKIVDELNDIGKTTKTDAKLGERTLQDVNAAEQEGAAAKGVGEDAKPTTSKPKAPDKLEEHERAVPVSNKPKGKQPSKEEVGEVDEPAAKPRVKADEPKTPKAEPPERALKKSKTRVFHASEPDLRRSLSKAIKEARKLGEGKAAARFEALLEKLRKTEHDHAFLDRAAEYFHAIDNPGFLEDKMAQLWNQARKDDRTVAGELEHVLGGDKGVNNYRPPANLSHEQEVKEFGKALQDPRPLVDVPFAGEFHGSHTHMFHQWIGDELWGVGEGLAFRRELAQKAYFEELWDAVFDVPVTTGGLNCPEVLGKILQDHLDFPLWEAPAVK